MLCPPYRTISDLYVSIDCCFSRGFLKEFPLLICANTGTLSYDFDVFVYSLGVVLSIMNLQLYYTGVNIGANSFVFTFWVKILWNMFLLTSPSVFAPSVFKSWWTKKKLIFTEFLINSTAYSDSKVYFSYILSHICLYFRYILSYIRLSMLVYTQVHLYSYSFMQEQIHQKRFTNSTEVVLECHIQILCIMLYTSSRSRIFLKCRIWDE